MVPFTFTEIPRDSVTCPFGVQLNGICKDLDLAPPTFTIRTIPSEITNKQRWEIETEILPGTTRIPTEAIVYKRVYPTWETGLLLAKHEALSRICEEFYEMLPQNSPYRRFGRRNANGLPHWSGKDREKLNPTELQMEDLELATHIATTALHAEMKMTDEAKELIEEQRKEIETTIEIIVSEELQKQKRETTIQRLEAENLKLLNKVDRQEATIAALREQCAQLARESFEEENSRMKRPKTKASTECSSRNQRE